MKTDDVVRDERTISIENSSYRWAYLLLSFGLLATIAYRSRVGHESNWDLMALVIAAGMIATLHQAFHRVLTRRWALVSAATLVIAAVVAIFMTMKP